MWYVIQTKCGEEQEVVELIRKTVSKEYYWECFFPLYENVWKSQGIHVKIESLFQGYICIKTTNPDALFLELKKLSRLSKILISGDKNSQYAFLSLNQEEEDFLNHIIGSDKEYTVRRTYIERNKLGQIVEVQGPLQYYLENLVKVDFKNRRAFIELKFLGEVRRIKLGIRLPKDDVI
ncbi:MAG: transcription termination/antitermination NusG family protein [Lachnospiraceae bacterium]